MKFRILPLLTVVIAFSFHSLLAQNTDIDLVKKHVYTLADDNLKGRGFGSADGIIASDYIRDQFIDAGVEPLLDNYFHNFIHRKGILNIVGRNVVGIVHGNDPILKNEYIILGAHYDHLGWELEDGDTVVYNGADDNASGVASIIELGRYLAANRTELKRSIILIAFDGEESGLIGSKRFVKDSVVNHDAIKAMFSIDMVGMYDANGGVELVGIELFENFESILSGIDTDDIVIKKTNATVENRTDTAPFGNAGIPAIYVATGISESPYHQPEDDSDLLEYEGMVTIIDFMSELTMALSNEEELTPAKKMVDKEKSGGMQRFYVGVMTRNGSSFFEYPDAYFKSKTIYSFGIGMFMELRLNQVITLQPEIIYETDGGMQELGNLRAHSVSTPFSLLFTTPDPENNRVRTYFQIGGYFTYSFGGKYNDISLDYGTLYNNQQYGIILGGGLEIFNLRIGFTHKTSFTDFLQSDGADGNMRLNGNYFTMGWAF